MAAEGPAAARRFWQSLQPRQNAARGGPAGPEDGAKQEAWDSGLRALAADDDESIVRLAWLSRAGAVVEQNWGGGRADVEYGSRKVLSVRVLLRCLQQTRAGTPT